MSPNVNNLSLHAELALIQSLVLIGPLQQKACGWALQKIGCSITMKDKIVNFTYITSILMLLAVVFGVLLMVVSTGLAVPLESIAAELVQIGALATELFS